jgi:DNA-binding CsgD family transcriptional regulator
MTSECARDVETPAMPRQEDFAATIGEALRLGWSGHFSAARSVLTALADSRPATNGERALCRAVLALTSAALDDLPAARRLARQAIHDSARPSAAISAAELRRLRLARALAVNASTLLGDVVRARRAAQARFMSGDPESDWLIRARENAEWQDAPAAVQRYAKFVQAVHRRYAEQRTTGPLTAAEIVILEHAAAGHSAVRIAALVNRSPHTVRTHLRNAYAKLAAHGREEAVAKARALRLLA